MFYSEKNNQLYKKIIYILSCSIPIIYYSYDLPNKFSLNMLS